MKFQAIFLAALASTGLAAPTFAPIYTLRLSSRTPALDGKYLSASNSTLGVYSNKPSSLKFFAVKNPETGLSELHTYPRTTDNTLALVGANGLLDLAALPNPASVPVPKGTTVDWQRFHLADEESAEAGSLGYAAGKEGSWVAFPTAGGSAKSGEWTVKWKDSSALTIQNYIPVKVVYELVSNFD